ncbi:ComEC/Rec2 family competence protein [uncultured Draconibacterium sp.]|uniref:ComEC/Rec2 family competence protein n=1 Tax=uncultured Draconibacterium sp. TaxID=1573823 RepID=UPI003260EEB7
MENTFNKITFLRIAAAFALGVFLASAISINTTIAVLLALSIIGVLSFLNKWYRFYVVTLFGGLSFIIFILFGAIAFNTHLAKQTAPKAEAYIATIQEAPQEKNNSFKSLLTISNILVNDSLFTAREKLLVYFEKTKKAENLQPGMQLIFRQHPTPIENRGNPYEFDYKKYLERKQVYRQVYLNQDSYTISGFKQQSRAILAEKVRNKLLKIYHSQNIGKQETEILSALTLGYKRDLDRETKHIFSSAGAMHVLAVSGLHVGILFFVFSYLFGFLQKRRLGKYVYVVASISFLWAYAFITGLSPSVMRACTMFSLIILASNINRRANIYNSLAASAFLLLLINPNNLFEVGFQLSYSAVFGIVYLQPKIAGLWQVKNKILLFFWNLATVSIAAQIATFPLSAYYFNQFPTYFLISNLIVIPAATVLIPLGLSLLILSSLPWVGAAISFIIKWIIKSVFFVLSTLETAPFSTVELVLHKTDLLLVIFILVSLLFLIAQGKAVFLKSALAGSFLLVLSVLYTQYNQMHTREIIVLNVKETTACFITSNQMYVVSYDSISTDDYRFFALQNIKRKKRLKKITFLTPKTNYLDNHLCIQKELLVFEGKKILFIQQNTTTPKRNMPSLTFYQSALTPHQDKKKVHQTAIYYYPSSSVNTQQNYKHSLYSQGAFTIHW